MSIDKASRKRQNTRINEIIDILIIIIPIFFTLYIAYFIMSYFAAPQRVVVGIIVISAIYLTLSSLRNRISIMPAWLSVIIMMLLILGWLIIGLYFYLEYPDLIYTRDGANTTIDLLMASLAVILIIFYTYIAYGPVIPLVVISFVFYGIFGWLFPGFLYHPGMSPLRLLQEGCLCFGGIFGLLPQVGLKYVAIFIILAAFVQTFGGLDFLIKLAHVVGKKNNRIIPQVAVISSMLFGSFSGSAAANVAGTGSFTIPLMKRFGIPPKTAGGIEATSSAGGQIMPPIMGTTAFVMAEYLGIQYVEVMMAGIFPAILFYMSIIVGVYIISLTYMNKNQRIVFAIENQNDEKIFYSIMQAISIIATLGTILYLLVVPKLDAMNCGFYGTLVYLAIAIVSWPVFGERRKRGQSLVKTLMDGTTRAMGNCAPIMILLSCLGIIVKVLVGSGLGTRLAAGIVELGANQLIPVIFLVMVLCILFGMAVTTVAAYILTVVIAGPALAAFNLPELPVHYAIFYFAMLSAITPPVAAIIPIACGISNSKFMETAWESMKLGVAKYLLPFCFILNPELLEFNSTGLIVFLFNLTGIIFITIGIQLKFTSLSQGVLIKLVLIILGYYILFYSNVKLIFLFITLGLGFLIVVFTRRKQWLFHNIA